MRRRTFLNSAAAVGAVNLAGWSTATEDGASAARPATKWRGVNLGGWLALEKWITPTLYAGTKAEDEYSLSQELGPKGAAERLKRHRETWITADDLRWLADRGINSVRIPINYGASEENPPFVPARETLDWAFETAAANGLGVLLDLHGVPGSQNAWDHSGRQGTLGWHTSRENVEHSLRIVDDLAARFGSRSNLIGFQLLNEPRWDVPMDILKGFYRDAYTLVRKHIPADRASVVIHDGFRPGEWSGFMQPPEYQNVVIDTHCYQCFTDEDKKRSIRDQIRFALTDREERVASLQKTLPCIVGEWSCALPPESLRGLHGFARDAAVRAYGDAQLLNYETGRGWFFWTYKTEAGGGWSFRDCVERGWLPPRFGDHA
ncbi:glycoside hydrolase family 5 protein [Paludisphaera rhizosphaerae]|uniref:glycoside hydrolase family 5 protein n=1 Tax=Paludisphaera rhizosphaerae TaxID=2711216 RepID=UPI0013EC6043|nr:glycoside hydrolase family 5 protein [Paludisphaera rhizosphaerae]